MCALMATTSEQNAGVDEEMIADTGIEAWLALLRPSPTDLAAGAALIASERVENGRMLRYVGERSASKMMGEMMGAPPGKDSSADAAWRFLASPAALKLYETLSETLARVVHTERKEDVMRLLAMLLTAQGLQYLRAFAHELWLHAGSPCATKPGQPTATTAVDWPACWAWCVAPSRPGGERARTMLTPVCLTNESLLRDCHIAAISYSDVHVVGHLLLNIVKVLILRGKLPRRPSICPIDMVSDFHAAIGTHKWYSIHPCMHWCGSDGLNAWTEGPQPQTTCPVCRTEIQFKLPVTLNASK